MNILKTFQHGQNGDDESHDDRHQAEDIAEEHGKVAMSTVEHFFIPFVQVNHM